MLRNLESLRKAAKTANNVIDIDNLQALLTGLKSCSMKRDLLRGRRIHARTVESRNDCNMYVATALIKMYAKCNSMMDSRHVFDSIQKPNVVAWTAVLLGYAEAGDGHAALDLFTRMKAYGCSPDSVTYVAALKACTSLAASGNRNTCLERGKEIHSEIGCHLGHRVQATLIGMYAKCGSMVDARHVFDSIQEPDVVSWTTLLLGYVDNGEGHIALDLFSRMKACGCASDPLAYVAALKACTSLAMKADDNEKKRYLEWGRKTHSEIGCHLDCFVQGTLIDMYVKCGSIKDARRVFDVMQNPDVVSWTVLLLGYAEAGKGFVALDLFSRMKSLGCVPGSVTYVAALKACTSLAVNGDNSCREKCLRRGREIHSEIGCHLDHHVQSTLIDMYAKCGSILDARRVFDSMQNPDVVSWSALLLGYAEYGDGYTALDLFSKMEKLGCVPNSVTYVAVLKACGLIGALARGRKFHSGICEFTAHVVTCLVDFYAKCGSMVEAREVFDLHSRSRTLSTWTALLAGYGSLGDSNSVFNLFEVMQDEGFQPDAVTLVCLLLCCSHGGFIAKAMEYFEAMPVKLGLTPTVMHYSCMVDVLGRANQLNEAIAIIRKMPCNPDVIVWTTLLCACRQWKNIHVGRLAFHALVDKDKNDASDYLLVAHIYGMWKNQDNRIKFGRELEG